MIGIRCKLCKEFVGSVDRKTKMCERCGLKAENAEIKTDLKVIERNLKAEFEAERFKARWEELKEYIKEKFIPLLDKPDDMRRLVRFRREIIRFMEQLESGGNDFESARDKHSVAGVRDCPANSLSKLPKPELEKKGMKK